VFKKSQNFQIWLQKAKLATLPINTGISTRTTGIRTRTACKVRGLHNAASTNAHSHRFAFIYTSLHQAKRTHRGRDFQKRCCRW